MGKAEKKFNFGDKIVIYEDRKRALYIGENNGHHVAVCYSEEFKQGELLLRNFYDEDFKDYWEYEYPVSLAKVIVRKK